jgi:hypothetical protein
MTTILVDRWFCDLCPHFRPREQRGFGVEWTNDGYWACEHCLRAYRLQNAGAGKEAYARAL